MVGTLPIGFIEYNINLLDSGNLFSLFSPHCWNTKIVVTIESLFTSESR